jgi:lipopolysaccharide export system protein LptA
MKRFVLFAVVSIFLYAEKIEVTSKNFYAKDAENRAEFVGDVVIKQDNSWVKSDRAIVYFNDKNETIQYDAIGKATFEIIKAPSHYKGQAEKLTYYPDSSKYLLAGDAIVNDLIKERVVKGNTIIVNPVTGESYVKGNTDKPIKFIFDTQKK